MEQLTLNIESRENKGKNNAGRLRRAGKLPGVLYGLGHNTTVTLDPRIVLRLLMTEGGRNQILNLKGGGVEARHAMIKDYQIDPLSRALLHVDLLEVDVTKKITVTVKVNLVGKAAGVAEGGVVNFIEREVLVRCLPTQIPSHLDVDVTPLRIGDSIHFDELKLPEGIEKGTHLNPTLVTVVPPTKEEEAAPSLAPAAEPEVITAKKEAPAEGAAAGDKAGEKKEEKK